MQKHRQNPDSEEMQKAEKENRRAIFAAKMIGLIATKSEEADENIIGYSNNHILINY